MKPVLPASSSSRGRPLALCLAGAALTLSGCGGGEGSSLQTPPTTDQRIEAATRTANENPKCAVSLLGSYYWEVGDQSGRLASGTRGIFGPGSATPMRYFSASKWLYASSVLQQRGVRDDDAPYLNFSSGYSMFGNVPVCVPSNATVAGCMGGRGQQDPSTVGRFAYDSGHMQVHASNVMNLGGADPTALAAALERSLGRLGITYGVAQPATGTEGTPAAYASFLQRLLRGELTMSNALGRSKVCAQSLAPGCNAAYTPDSIGTEAWNYSLGHWVEDDPAVGDHAFSSAGGGGFYPWIDASKEFYGIVARERTTESHAGYHSAECGRLIRQAWLRGQVTLSTTPDP